MEARQSHKLELIAHLAQLYLELRNGLFIQLLAPVEGGRAVVGQQLTWESGVDGLCEAPRLFHVWLGSLAPDQVRVRRVRKATRDGRVETAANTEEPLGSALAGQKFVDYR